MLDTEIEIFHRESEQKRRVIDAGDCAALERDAGVCLSVDHAAERTIIMLPGYGAGLSHAGHEHGKFVLPDSPTERRRHPRSAVFSWASSEAGICLSSGQSGGIRHLRRAESERNRVATA